MENEFEVSKEDMGGPDTHPPAQPPHFGNRQAAAQRKKRLLIIVAAATAGLLLAGAAIWFFVLRKPAPKQAAQTSESTNQTNQAEDLPAPTPADSTPVTFKSTKLNLELTHRKDWTLTENADGELVLTSPRTTYSRIDGTAGAGVFTVKIRKGATEAMKATIEKSVAARDSEVIGYTSPTESQRHYTNVSYAGVDKGESFSFFIITGSTEIKAGKPFAYMLAFDSESYLFVGGYGEDKDGSLSFDAVAKSDIESTSKEQAIDIIESIKLF